MLRLQPLLLGLLSCAVLMPSATAQDEMLEEIEDFIAEMEERRDEGADPDDVRAALRTLRQVRKLRLSSIRLERLTRRAEQRDDEEAADALREKLERQEMQSDALMTRLELLEAKISLTELRAELDEEGLDGLAEEAQQLERLLFQRAKLTDQMLKRIDADDIGDLEDRLEELEQEFARGYSILELSFELHQARRDGDDEAIEELEELLQRRRQGIPEDEDDYGEEDEDGEMLRRPRRLDEDKSFSEMVRPIEIQDADVVAAAKLSFPDRILPLLQQHCFECHDASGASGDLNLEALVAGEPFVVNRTHWINVKQQIRLRSMPPEDAPVLRDEDRSILVAWLTHSIDRFDYSTVRQPGYEIARRLTHAEYNNTIRDLFGVDVRPADRFPADLRATSGFDNSANSLFIQPVLLERYIGAAERAVEETMGPSADPVQRADVTARLIGDRKPVDAVLAFAERAWRRPLPDSDRDRLRRHFEQLTGAGRSSDQAFRDVLQVILVSPRFLIRNESRPSGQQEFRVDDFDLASRLSYFLWASLPDATLTQLASQGRLSDAVELSRQVDRMLDDPRATTLGTIFAAQWLGFGNLDRIQPDQIDNPWATDSLIDSMKQESAMLFNSLVATDAPIESLVTADYTFVNQELARHYRMRGVAGPQMRRVSLKNSPRGGVLGHGSVLALTSFPGRTSPVVRGNWILTDLLGTPPPPPPPNVSQFDEELEDRDSLSQREKMKLHRRKPNCYVCHSEIDPLGFALEEFGWFGQYRGGRRGEAIDSQGRLPSGTVVDGLAGLQQALVSERRDDLVRQIARKLLSYALGRQLEYYDEATVQEIIASVEADDRKLRSLIHAIVGSDAFQKKRLPGRS